MQIKGVMEGQPMMNNNNNGMPQRRSPKRGSDELLTQTTNSSVSNGSMMSPPPNHADNNNEAKKVKLDKNQGINKPSRVIHIRNIPNEVSEGEIIHLGVPFGRVTNVLVLKGKNQAFLEMADEISATTMVSYFTNCIAQLRGRNVFIQFSNHKELKTDSTHSNAMSNEPPQNAQSALQATQVLIGQNDTQGGPNTVLRVIVEHMVYPVTLEVLYQIFSRVGKILKIVTFTKTNTFQALIQYPDVMSAQSAKMNLDGQNIYNACCTLRIEYSKLTNLNVKYNNEKSRDYTNPTLPIGDPTLDSIALDYNVDGMKGGQKMINYLHSLYRNSGQAQFDYNADGMKGGQKMINYLHSFYHNSGQAQFGSAAGVLGSPFAAMHGLGAPLTAYAPTAATVGEQYLYPFTAGSPLAGFVLPGSAAGQAALGAAGIRLPGQQQVGCVLLVNNLNEETVTPDALFTLFGVYGDVHRVKILFNKKDNALIQMAEPHQAQLAMTHLDKVKVLGKQIRVMASRHQSVQMPREGQPDAGLTKDFTSSGLHRFKKPGSKNYQNIYPPSATLHLSNIPNNISEEEIKESFVRNGAVVKGFKFFAKDRKMALIQLGSVEEAVATLIKMHNFQLSDSNHLRVSFSKSTI